MLTYRNGMILINQNAVAPLNKGSVCLLSCLLVVTTILLNGVIKIASEKVVLGVTGFFS